MARTRRLYVPIDVGMFEDGRIIRAGERATFMYLKVLVLVKSRDADGIIEPEQLSRLHIKDWRKRLAVLLDVGLLLEMEDGNYLIPSWSKWNELSHDRAQRLAHDRDRKRRPKGEDSDWIPGGFRADSALKKERKKERTPTPPPVGEVIASQNQKVKGGK